MKEANDLVRNDHADSNFSWNQQEVVYPLLPEILVKFSTYPDPLEGVHVLKDRATPESLNKSQAACCFIDHKIWLATVWHYVRGHFYSKGAWEQRYNLPPVFNPTQTSLLFYTRPKPLSCFWPSQTSFLFSTRPKPLSCFRPESNLLPVFCPDPNLPEKDQKERKTNQKTHQPKRKIYNPNSGLQTGKTTTNDRWVNRLG